MTPPSSNVDEKFGEYDPASQSLSNARYAEGDQSAHSYEVGAGFGALAPLALVPDEPFLAPGRCAMPTSDSPMLCDSVRRLPSFDRTSGDLTCQRLMQPADFTLSQALYAGGQISYDHSPAISPASTLVDLSSSSPSSDLPSSPLTAVPSRFSSPLFRSSTFKVDDAPVALDNDFADLHDHGSELSDLFFPVEPSPSPPFPLPMTLSSPGIAPSQSLLTGSSSSEPAHSLSPQPEIIMISPADDSTFPSDPRQASAPTSSPGSARVRPRADRTPLLPPTTSQSSRAPASSGSLSTPRLTRSRRAIQRTEETPGDEGMPSVRPIRSLPARAARSGRRPPMVYPSSPLTPTAGPSRSAARRGDDENDNDSDYQDNDKSGDYCPGSLSESSSRKRRSKRQGSSDAGVKKVKHRGRFPCPHCTKDYSRAHDSSRHALTCRDNPSRDTKGYKCPRCPRSLSREDAVKRHLKTCQPKGPSE